MSTLLGSPSLDFMYISASAPDAPPLSETTTGCFIRLFFWIADCIIRAIWSDAPPAPAATTISTGLVGSQATAGAVASTMASPAAAPRQAVLISGISSSLDVCRGRPGENPLWPVLAVGGHSAALRRWFKSVGGRSAGRDPSPLDPSPFALAAPSRRARSHALARRATSLCHRRADIAEFLRAFSGIHFGAPSGTRQRYVRCGRKPRRPRRC